MSYKPPNASSTLDQVASVPRIMLRRLAMLASRNPIEAIVSVFILVTLAYFKLLHAISRSGFFQSLESLDWQSTVDFPTQNLTFASGIWSKTSTGWEPASPQLADEVAYSIRPIVFVDTAELQEGVLATVASATAQNLGHSIAQTKPLAANRSTVSFAAAFATFREETVALQQLSDETILQDAIASVKLAGAELRLSPVVSAQTLVQAGRTVPRLAHSQNALEQFRSFRWMAYASRSLFLRFLALLKVRTVRCFCEQ